MLTKSSTPSTRAGMGAVPYAGGVSFRVWAPHAEQVFVAGDFNAWSQTGCPLVKEEHGYWYGEVSGAKPGDEYKYVLQVGEQTLLRNDPYAREVTHSNGNSVVVDPAFDWGEAAFQMPAWNELVIYELHIGTFNRKDQDAPGDFASAIEKLPYLRDLGINAIEVMPAAEFPGGLSWGYNPAYPFAVERDYGGAKAFKELVKAAHAQGIAVILDVVYNHFGPTDLDLWQFDGWSENGKGGIYFYNDDRAATPWGDTRPDYGRGEVRQYLRDNALLWLEEYRIDGLRFDATAFIRNIHGGDHDDNDLPEGWSMLQWLHEELQQRTPWKITIAEDLRNNEWVSREVGAGGMGFSTQWDPDFVHTVREAIIAPNDDARSPGALREALLHRYNGDAFQRVIYTESHDEVANGRARLPEEIWPGNVGSFFSKKRSTLGAALVLTAPGIPMLFQGQEFLEDRWFEDTDPLDWGRLKNYGGLAALYADLIRLRRNLEGTTRGLCGQNAEVTRCDEENKVLVMHRWDQGGAHDSVVVVANLANRALENYEIGFPAAGLWKVRLNSDWQGYDAGFSDHPSLDVTAGGEGRDDLPASAAVSLGPYSVVIYSLAE